MKQRNDNNNDEGTYRYYDDVILYAHYLYASVEDTLLTNKQINKQIYK